MEQTHLIHLGEITSLLALRAEQHALVCFDDFFQMRNLSIFNGNRVI